MALVIALNIRRIRLKTIYIYGRFKNVSNNFWARRGVNNVPKSARLRLPFYVNDKTDGDIYDYTILDGRLPSTAAYTIPKRDHSYERTSQFRRIEWAAG